jgi:hypothetical protein
MHVISTVFLMTFNLCQSELLRVEFLAFELHVLHLPKNVLSIAERVKTDKHCIMTGVYTEVKFLIFYMFLLSFIVADPVGSASFCRIRHNSGSRSVSESGFDVIDKKLVIFG